MGYIAIHHFASDEQRAQAMPELVSIKSPPGVLRDFNGERIYHRFYQDHETPVVFPLRRLEDFINWVRITS